MQDVEAQHDLGIGVLAEQPQLDLLASFFHEWSGRGAPPTWHQTHEVTGRVVHLTANTATKTFHHTDGGSTITAHVVDFIVDADDVSSTVEVWIDNYAPPFRPIGGFAQYTSASPYGFRFTIPYSGAPISSGASMIRCLACRYRRLHGRCA